MGFDVVSFAASNSYTDETVEGGGAIKGKNCVIDSIDDITGGHKVNFKWTLDDGTELEGSMNVMDGQDGQDGTDGVTPSFSIGTVEKGDDAEASITGTDANPVLNLVLPKGEQGISITGATINAQRHLILERSGDASDLDAGQLAENVHTYSTTEHVVGTWIDGKPVYEIVVSGSLSNLSAGYNNLNLISSDNKNLVYSSGMLKTTWYGNYWEVALPSVQGDATSKTFKFDLTLRNYNGYLSFLANISQEMVQVFGTLNVVAIFQYTKTTD